MAGGRPRPPAFILLFLSSSGSLPETWKSADESGSNRCGETSCHLVIWRGRKRRVWGVLTFRYTAPARAGNGGRGHGCCPVPIRPTQWLTRPNGAVLSPPAGRRSSLCQQHRDPGIEWTCISSLCPSASRPSKVGPGFCPELWPAYSRTRCLPLPCRMAAPPTYLSTITVSQKTPCSIMASATRLKPAMLAPATRL